MTESDLKHITESNRAAWNEVMPALRSIHTI